MRPRRAWTGLTASCRDDGARRRVQRRLGGFRGCCGRHRLVLVYRRQLDRLDYERLGALAGSSVCFARALSPTRSPGRALLTRAQPGAASGLVSLDSATPQSVNCSRPDAASQVAATTIAVPDVNQHTLTVAWDPKSAKGAHLDVDAFRLTGPAPKVVGGSSKPPANVNVGSGSTPAATGGSTGVLVDQTSPLISASALSCWYRVALAAACLGR